MTDIEQYVEKAATAIHTAKCKHCEKPDPVQMRHAAAALAAVYADIRRDVGEEIAQAIEAERFDFTFGTQPPGNSSSFARGYRRSLGAAIRIARAVGNA